MLEGGRVSKRNLLGAATAGGGGRKGGLFCSLLFHCKARKTELKWLLGVGANVRQLHMSMKSHGHIDNRVHKPVNGNLYTS